MDSNPLPPLFRCSKCNTHKPLEDFPPSKAHNASQWCRTCLRVDQRRIKGLSAVDRTVSCDWCAKVFPTSYAKAQFCSSSCKSKFRNRARQAVIDAAKPDRICPHCGKALPRTMKANASFCSAECNSAAHAITRKMAKRAGRSKRPTDPLIERNYIAQRDNFRCGICGGKVNMNLTHPDPMYGSIDHIVPVSISNDSGLANLQLAHLRCNITKRDRGGPTQLRLIG